MTEPTQPNRPQRQFMDFAPRARSIDGMKRPAPQPKPRPTPQPTQRPVQTPAPQPVARVTTVATEQKTTVIVPKAPVKPTIEDKDRPTPVVVKSETTETQAAIVEIPDEEPPRRPERHGIIAQLEESSDFGLFGGDIIESRETPKNVFINTDKVDKRPLGATANGPAPLKNLYKKSSPKPIKDNVPTVVTSTPDKKNSITLLIAGLLTIVLGGIVGTFIYLAFFQ